jgi:hypothetical protein
MYSIAQVASPSLQPWFRSILQVMPVSNWDALVPFHTSVPCLILLGPTFVAYIKKGDWCKYGAVLGIKHL